MRFDVSSNPVRLALVAPIGGVLVAATLGTLSLGRQGRFDPENISICAIAGLVGGIASIVYVLPLLTWTDIRKSVPLVYGGSLAAAGVAGVMSRPEFGLVSVAGLHIALCIASAVFFRKIERRAMECPQCRYLLKGVRDPKCPECGMDLEQWRRKKG